MSERPSSFCPRSCSGDMNSSVPSVWPTAVSAGTWRSSDDHLGDAEVEHLDVVLAAARLDEDVLRLHVAVDDAVVRAPRPATRPPDPGSAAPASPPQRPVGLLQLVQAPAAQQLHRQVEDPVGGLVEVVGGDGVRVAQLRAGLGLAPEARDDRLVRDVVRVEDLQRHLAAGGDLLAPEHGPEAALADLVLDEVAVVQGAADQVLERLRRAADGAGGAPPALGAGAGGAAGAGRGTGPGVEETSRTAPAGGAGAGGGTDGRRRSRDRDAGTPRSADGGERDVAAAAATVPDRVAAAARLATAVGVIGRPQAPQNRAPSLDLVLRSVDRSPSAGSASREGDSCVGARRLIALALHDEDAARRRRDQPSRNSASSERRPRGAAACRSRRVRPVGGSARRARPWSGCRPPSACPRGSRSSTVSRARLAESALDPSARGPDRCPGRSPTKLTVSSGAGGCSASPSKRASTTVMLSGPSRSSAFWISASPAFCRFGSAIRTARISSSADRPVQPVRAEQGDVALAQLHLRQHHLDALLHAQRLQDDVGVLEGLGLVGGHRARLDQLPGERLVLGHLRQLAVAQDVAARVADLRDDQRVVDQAPPPCRWCPSRARSGCRATG